MNFLKNLKLGARLSAGFAIVLALMITMSAVALLRFVDIGAMNAKLIDEQWVKAQAAQDLAVTWQNYGRTALDLVVSTDRTRIEGDWKQIDANKGTAEAALATLDQLVTRPDGMTLLANVKEQRVEFLESLGLLRTLIDNGQTLEATQLVTLRTLPAIDAMNREVGKLNALQARLVDEEGAHTRAQIESGQKLLLALSAIGMIIGVFFAWWLTRSITIPIREAVTIARTVAAGDLTSDIRVRSRDETGQLLGALKDMNESLERIVSQVRLSSDSIAVGSGQIATGNADLSQRTEEQASNLQQTAASMEELSTTIGQNSDTARQANQLAQGASDAAARGGAVVGQVVETMNEITASSNRIAQIISVIDGIAFQTNILALNAAVEAARAGEQGRGFAVVAGEVRSLAQRSAEAAREIKTLIDESVDKVQTGSKYVGEAGRSMDEIVGQVRRVTDLIGEISSASEQQAGGVGQVSDAVTQLDQVTQQNAALVEESAAAAESLKQQAESLAQAVAVFRLNDANDASQLIAQVRAASRMPAKAPASAAAGGRSGSSPGAGSHASAARAKTPAAASSQAKLAPVEEEEEWTAF